MSVQKRSKFARRFAALSIIAAAASALVGCETVTIGRPAEFLAINYQIRTQPDTTTMITDLNAGTTNVGSYMTPNPCEFEAAFTAGAGAPIFGLFGTPGQGSANVNFLATAPNSRLATNSECRDITDVTVTIGDTSTTLNIGVPVNVLQGSLTANGPGLPADAAFSSGGGYFEGRITSFNSSTGYYTAEFEYLAIGPGDFILLATGSFGGS